MALLGCTSPLGNLRATKLVEMLLLQHGTSDQSSDMISYLGSFGKRRGIRYAALMKASAHLLHDVPGGVSF